MAYIQTNNGNILTSGSLVFSTSQSNNLKVDGTSILFLTASKAGVNNVTPAYTLDINGDSNVSGNTRVNGVVLVDNARNITATSITTTGNISSSAAITAVSFTGSFSGSIGTAAYASTATSASYALTSSYSALANNATNVVGGAVTASGIFTLGNVTIGGNLTLLGSGSVVNISSSVIDIGANKILLNAYSPFQRYAGISAQDSGSSTALTSSLYWDSLNNYWLFQGDAGLAGAIQSSSVMIGGPVSQLGSETLLTVNYIPKATTGVNIGNSLLSDNGTQLNYTGTSGFLTNTISSSNQNTSGNITAGSITSPIISGVTTITATGITSSFVGYLSGSLSGSVVGSAGTFTTLSSSNEYVSGNTSVVGTITGGNILTYGTISGSSNLTTNLFTASNSRILGNEVVIGNITAASLNATSITGSFSGSIIGSIIGTSSWATNATTSTTSSYVTGSNSIIGSLTASAISISGFISNAGLYNNIIGTSAGLGTATTASNFFGPAAGLSASSANYSNFFGSSSAYQATNAHDSNFMGRWAGFQATNAFQSNFFGYNSGDGATNANNSNFIGFYTGVGATGANNSNFIGFQAGINATNANNSIFIGNNAGNADTVNNTGGTHTSILIGDNTSTKGFNDSIAIGSSTANSAARQINLGGVIYATGILTGSTATAAAVSGSKVGIGISVPVNTLDVNGNISASIITASLFFGTASYTSTASYINASGITTGTLLNSVLPSQINVTGITASFLGTSSWAYYATTASYAANATSVSASAIVGIVATSSVAIYSNSGSVTLTSTNASYYVDLSTGTSGIQPTYVGSGLTFNPSTNTLLTTNVTASSIISTNNVQLGGYLVNSGSSPIGSNIVGGGAGQLAAGATYSNFFGYYAGNVASAANYSNFFGYYAGQGAVASGNSNFIGNNAGQAAVGASYSNFIGFLAGQTAIAANSSNFIGNGAGKTATYANNSNFIGTNTGQTAVSASNSNFIGFLAGNNATNASHANFMGFQAGSSATYANSSIFIGDAAGNNATSASYSVCIGFQAGNTATNATNATFIGYNAGSFATNASNATFIGYNAGNNDVVNNSGNRSSILIGDYTSTGGFPDSIAIGKGTKNFASGSLNIGNVIYATGIYSSSVSTSASIANGKVGIGTFLPVNALDVNGNISCSVITASLFLGTASWSNNAVSAISASFSATSSYSLGSANAFLNNGNSFGGLATLGTNDGNSLNIRTNSTTRLVIDTNAGITASAVIAPSADNTYTLGTSGVRFKDFFSVQSTIGALFETGLATVGISLLDTGTVLTWRNGKLIPSDEEFDEMVMGVVQNGKDEPIVFGAEPVLVTGIVNEGDYIVTSNKVGHGMGIPRNSVSPLELFGKVLAQAVESGSGDSYIIKAMIRKM